MPAERGLDDAGLNDAGILDLAMPRVQLAAAVADEADMVEADVLLREGLQRDRRILAQVDRLAVRGHHPTPTSSQSSVAPAVM